MFLFTDGHGGALGASGVIYALLAIAMIWAPQNDIHFFYAWGFWFVGTLEIPIIVVGCFYIAMELLHLSFIGWHMSTPMLHILGATVGIPFAIVMLRTGRVDCEGWDLFSRLGWNMKSIGPKHFNLLWVVGRLAEERSKEKVADDATPSTPAPTQTIHRQPSGFQPMFEGPLGIPRDPCAAALHSLTHAVSAGDVERSMVAMEN